jgi:hypothetical protein
LIRGYSFPAFSLAEGLIDGALVDNGVYVEGDRLGEFWTSPSINPLSIVRSWL